MTGVWSPAGTGSGGEGPQRQPPGAEQAAGAVDPAAANDTVEASAGDADAAGQAAAEESASRAALARYNRRTRRARGRYVAALAVIVAVLGAWVVVTYARGEASHTTLHTASHPAATVPLAAPAATVQAAWHTGDRLAIGTPYVGGTVITYSTHAVHGRDAATGAVRWSYTRSDREVCQAIQVGGVTVAIYRIKGSCQEVTALDSQTGRPDWSRTLFENAEPITGTPTYQVTQDTLMIIGSGAIYAIAPLNSRYNQGIDRWIYAPQNCTINGAVLGTAGALISQTCHNRNCSGLTYCAANGTQLLLRDGYTAQSDEDAQKANPDNIDWMITDDNAVPVAADGQILARDPTSGTVQVISGKGRITERLSLPGTSDVGGSSPAPHVSTASGELIWLGGRSALINSSGVAWSRATSGPISLGTPTGSSGPSTSPLSDAIALAPVTGGVALLDPRTGAVRRTYPLGAPTGSLAWPLGDGFVLGAPGGTTLYR